MLLAGTAVVVLVGTWVAAVRAQLRRTAARGREWEGDGQRPRLWTSAARCRVCGAAAGVLDESGSRVSFLCLRCGQSYERRTRG